MSNENMSKRIPEWIIAFGVVVAMGGIWVSVMTTNRSIRAQEQFLDRSIRAQEQILERQNRVALSGSAYTEFLIDLLPTPEGVMNSRIPIALYGSRGVIDDFISLKKEANDEDKEFKGSAELQKSLLSFLNAIRVDVLGENHALSDSELKAILSMK